MRFLALLFGEWVWDAYSFIIVLVLRAKGVRVGQRVRFEGSPRFLIRGKASNIRIGNNVRIMGDTDIRNRENGQILIGDGCRIDHGVRLIAARDAVLSIGDRTDIGISTVINCGGGVSIGNDCLVSGFVYIQSSNHNFKSTGIIKDQGHLYAPVKIGDGVWIGSHVSILPGAVIGDGAVIGSKAVVNDPIPPKAIAVGVPAVVKGYRESA